MKILHALICSIAIILNCGFLGAQSNDNTNGLTLAQVRLAGIVAKQERLFAAVSKAKAPDVKELTRKIQGLVADYESYLADNPKDLTALILYGKFLRGVDQPGPATGMFIKADRIDPEVAVVKQQIANYLVEEGRIAEALPYLLRAVELSPKTALYHNQLGTFLFLFNDELIRLGITTNSSNDRNMVIAFREAAKLEPENLEYQLRYAQSFFDVAKPDWAEALRVWQQLSIRGHRSLEEGEYFLLCQARVLLELGRRDEARKIIDRVTSPAMRATKKKLLDLLAAPQEKLPLPVKSKKEKTNPDKNKNAQWKRPSADELFFDENLQNLRQIAERLEEEKLLRDLRVEAVRATYDDKGKVKMSLSEIVEAPHPKQLDPKL